MTIAELADNATHEDIEEFVDQAVKDAEETEGKGDSQRIAEDQDQKIQDETKAAETDSGSDDTAEKGEEAGDSETQAQDWLDDDLKAEVAAYGIDEKELADFTSREELERALRFFDRSALEAGRKAMAEGDKDTGKNRDKQGRFTKAEPESEPKDERPVDGRYEISLDKDAYDEDLIAEFTQMRDHYESRLEALEDRFMEADAMAKQQRFDAAVDAMGHADLFGKTGSETSKQLERRQDLFVASEAQELGMQMYGRGAGPYESLVNRVARMVFADDLGKKELKARTQRVSKQSNNRMGGGATKAHNQKEPLIEEMERLYKELEGA